MAGLRQNINTMRDFFPESPARYNVLRVQYAVPRQGTRYRVMVHRSEAGYTVLIHGIDT